MSNSSATVKSLKSIGLTEDQAKTIRAIWKADNIQSLVSGFPELTRQVEQGSHHGYIEGFNYRKALMINLVGNYEGIEFLGIDKRTGKDIDYCNAGDTCKRTIVFISHRLIVSSLDDM